MKPDLKQVLAIGALGLFFVSFFMQSGILFAIAAVLMGISVVLNARKSLKEGKVGLAIFSVLIYMSAMVIVTYFPVFS